MNAKKAFLAGLLGMCWSWYTIRAQEVPSPENPPPPVTQDAVPAPVPSPDTGGTGLSQWITYDRNNCCIGRGGGMPILTEVLFRVGPSFPIGGEFFGRNLEPGWMIEGGARALFFDRAWTAAWAVELGISNTYNPSQSDRTIILKHGVPGVAGIPPGLPIPVGVRAFDRTFINLGLGREWYLWSGAGINDEWHVRFGTDVGGRWGSGTVKFFGVDDPNPNFNNPNIPSSLTTPGHHTQVIEGFFIAAHADFEFPCGRFTYLAGIRTEYAFTYSNIFEPGVGNMQDVTLLFNLGVRY